MLPLSCEELEKGLSHTNSKKTLFYYVEHVIPAAMQKLVFHDDWNNHWTAFCFLE